MEKQEEKTYTITNFTAVDKQVTKEQYVQHLSSKLNYALEVLQDQELKLIKAKEKRQELEEKLMMISNELDALVSADEHAKIIDYAFWRYREMYPKKAAKLETVVKRLDYRLTNESN